MNSKKSTTSDEYMSTLEEVKKQYRQYLEISGLYDLPISKEQEEHAESAPPCYENPLTTNTFEIRR